jgi:hypothetical protein
MKRARAKIALACDGIFVWLSGYADERADGSSDRSGHDLPGPRRRREKMYSGHSNQSRDHTRNCSARGDAAVRDYHQKSAEQASVGNRRNRLSAKVQSGPIVPQETCVILNHPTVPDEWSPFGSDLTPTTGFRGGERRQPMEAIQKRGSGKSHLDA